MLRDLDRRLRPLLPVCAAHKAQCASHTERSPLGSTKSMGLTWQFQKLLRRMHCRYFGTLIAQLQAGQATRGRQARTAPPSPCCGGQGGRAKPDRELIRPAIGSRITGIAREARYLTTRILPQLRAGGVGIASCEVELVLAEFG